MCKVDIPKLSVLITDDELRHIVKEYIEMLVQLDNEYGTCQSWHELVETSGEEAVPTIERLRIAYNMEV